MLKADKTFMANGVKISQYLLHNHNVNKIDLPVAKINGLLGVTIHNTDDLNNVEDDAEQYTRATVNGNMKSVRVHYYVDDIGAWQNLDEAYQSWHAADGNGNGNTKTISIECIMTGKNQAQDIKAKDNAARLAAWILSRHGLTDKSLFTHTHWLNVKDGVKGTREYLNTKPNPYKICPYFIMPKWSEFEQLVGRYINGLGGTTAPQASKIYRVQVGAFGVKANADKYAAELKGKGYSVITALDGKIYRVQVGAFSIRANADKLAKELQGKGYKTIIKEA